MRMRSGVRSSQNVSHSQCTNHTTVFAECAQNRTFTATWKCRAQRHAMNSCMIGYATLKEQDAAREEWFAGRDDRAREKETKEREKSLQKQKHHERWGLDEQGRRKVEPDGSKIQPTQQGNVVDR